MIGTQGSVEWRRSLKEKPKVRFAGTQMSVWTEVDWGYGRTDAPSESKRAGHGNAAGRSGGRFDRGGEQADAGGASGEMPEDPGGIGVR